MYLPQLHWIMVSERLHVESAVYAGQLIKAGAIGRVVQVMGMGPHRLNPQTRPPWFFEHAKYGGILCDIGSHQIEQFLYYVDCKNAQVVQSKIGNYHWRDYPDLEDFGNSTLVGDNGATVEPSSWELKAILSCENILISHGTPRETSFI